MPDDLEQRAAAGRLHADLVAWEDAWRHGEVIRPILARKDLDPADRAYWRGYVERMDALAAGLAKHLMPPKEAAK